MQIEDLNPAKYNPRLYLQPGDEQYEHIKNSLETFGYLDPIIVNVRDGKNIIVGGHQRSKVLKELGYTEIDVIQVDMDEDKEKACNLALNKAQGDWDDGKLTELLAELKDTDFNMDDFGFNEELDALAEDLDNIKEDEVPDVPLEPKAKIGQVYRLGNHRLMCGDSTNANHVTKLLDNNLADLLLTDPPYNVDYEEKEKHLLTFRDCKRVRENINTGIKNDKMTDKDFIIFLNTAFSNANNSLKEGGAFYIWYMENQVIAFINSCKANKFKVSETLIWNKNNFVIGRQDYHHKHEPCLYGWKEGAAHYFIDDRTQHTIIEDGGVDFKKMKRNELLDLLSDIYADKTSTTIINEDKPHKSDLHPTMKPIKLLARLIKNSSKQGDIVLDLFGGSGSTLIASEQLNRVCYMMEYEPKYVDVIITRWEAFTGLTAELVDNYIDEALEELTEANTGGMLDGSKEE